MSPYLGATDLVGVIPGLPTITGSSTPLTMSEVASVIGRIEGELHSAAAAAGYVIPIPTTATAAYAQMEAAVESGAGWTILRRTYPNMGGPGDKSSLAADYRDAYRDFVKLLREGKMPLVGHTSDAGQSGRELPRYGGNATPMLAVGSTVW